MFLCVFVLNYSTKLHVAQQAEMTYLFPNIWLYCVHPHPAVNATLNDTTKLQWNDFIKVSWHQQSILLTLQNN